MCLYPMLLENHFFSNFFIYKIRQKRFWSMLSLYCWSVVWSSKKWSNFLFGRYYTSHSTFWWLHCNFPMVHKSFRVPIRQVHLLTNIGSEHVYNIQENEAIKIESLHNIFLYVEIRLHLCFSVRYDISVGYFSRFLG